jgi:hypothetical protein
MLFRPIHAQTRIQECEGFAMSRMRSIAPLELAASGGLMAYGVNFPDQFRRAAVAKAPSYQSDGGERCGKVGT